MSDFKEVYNNLITNGVIGRNNTGCSYHEIKVIEDKYGITLPKSYRDFLEVCGKACEVFDENEFYYQYKYVECMTEQLLQDRIELIQEADEFEDYKEFPENIFFILDRYGEEYLYIIAEGGVDTGVYYHNYPDDTFDLIYDSVGDWFKVHALDMRKLRDNSF